MWWFWNHDVVGDDAAGRVWEEVAQEVCRGFPLLFCKYCTEIHYMMHLLNNYAKIISLFWSRLMIYWVRYIAVVLNTLRVSWKSVLIWMRKTEYKKRNKVGHSRQCLNFLGKPLNSALPPKTELFTFPVRSHDYSSFYYRVEIIVLHAYYRTLNYMTILSFSF